MYSLQKEITFNTQNGKLWMSIVMTGLVRIDYVWDLYSLNQFESYKLTKTSREGDNDSPHDDYFIIINDNKPEESVEKQDNRKVKVLLDIMGKPKDKYGFIIEIKQGNEYANAHTIGKLESGMKELPGDEYHVGYNCQVKFKKGKL